MRGITVLYEDRDLIVIEKAAGVLTCETRRGGEYTVEGALTDYVRKGQARSRLRVYLVQRLDRETSGVMMVAKTEAAETYFREHWNEVTEKTYLALVEGTPDRPEGVFESYLAEDPRTLKVASVADPSRGKFARTEWKVLPSRLGPARTLVMVKLHSGRKNQIRVHFAEAGHPVVGDAKYGRVRPGAKGRMCLHSQTLSFLHPRTGERMEFSAKPPDFLQHLPSLHRAID